MKMGFRTRIYPNEEQKQWLEYYTRCSHDMWNFVVAKFKNNEKAPICSKYGIKDYNQRQLLNEFGKENIPERIALDVLIRYSEAWKKCFAKMGKAPKFHKYNPNKQSFAIVSRTYDIVNGKVQCPAVNKFRWKVGMISINTKYLDKRGITSITEPTFTCIRGKWYISGSWDIEEPQKKETSSRLGLDWGLKNFLTTSEGEYINYPNSVKRQFYRINALKSKRDKKVKGSNNWLKLNQKVERAYERLEGIKRDFIEQTTTVLSKENNIAAENLTQAGIRMSDKRRRRNMQIAPLDRFIEKLEWKCQKFGTEFKRINPAYTSQTCSKCGAIKHDLKLKDRVFRCECGYEEDRDINAAINIVVRGFC